MERPSVCGTLTTSTPDLGTDKDVSDTKINVSDMHTALHFYCGKESKLTPRFPVSFYGSLDLGG